MVEARKAVAAARAEVEAAVQRIQREARAAAEILYPVAAPLARIREELPGETALVLYGFEPRQAVALVATRADARIVRLATPAEIEAACEAIALDDPGSDPEKSLASLRRLVVEPLALGEDVQRVLVSPVGALSYVSFAALMPNRSIAHVPSGTARGVLLASRATEGEGVLALGDPDYVTARGSGTRGRKLAPLPATREEAKAIGDVVLLGEEATETRLTEALASRPRWSAVHLACHGLVDAKEPLRTSLAVTPDEKTDGHLTVLEVCGMRVPADLVALSACDTARGKVFKAEGVVGLTRAFMLAGAPRVIVSLWKVDDEATGALMRRFYSLWRPPDGSPGLAAAEALRQAQAFVRSKEAWRHPYFWAAWQLWGLAE
jgi:CHAT domain-containing protein